MFVCANMLAFCIINRKHIAILLTHMFNNLLCSKIHKKSGNFSIKINIYEIKPKFLDVNFIFVSN